MEYQKRNGGVELKNQCGEKQTRKKYFKLKLNKSKIKSNCTSLNFEYPVKTTLFESMFICLQTRNLNSNPKI